MVTPKTSRHISIRKKHIYLVLCILASLIIVSDAVIIAINAINSMRHQAFIKTITSPSSVSNNPVSNQSSLQAAEDDKNPYAVAQPPTAQFKNYKTPASHPKYLIIPKLGITTRILQVGVTKDNAIDTPNNGYDTAWYEKSSLPGDTGATFIDGHVDGYYSPGVFYYLSKLVAGDTIQITRGDNTTVTYVVSTLKTYTADTVNMDQVLSSIDPAKPGLNLMTCSGKLIDNNTHFTERLVVFSILQS